MSFAGDVWKTLSTVDCNSHVEKKGSGNFQLTYLSWVWAWATLMEHYPESEYVFESPESLANGTCEVWVSVTVKDADQAMTRKMWLPVMDNKNNSIQNPTSRQISDCRMRCLTKCLALFGLGHYIYAGEDVPGNLAEEEKPEVITKDQAEQIHNACMVSGMDEAELCKKVRIQSIESLESSRFDGAMKFLQGVAQNAA